MLLSLELQVADGGAGLPSDVACEVVGPPALARSGNQEPVVIQTHFEASNFVVAIAVDVLVFGLSLGGVGGFVAGRSAGSLLQILLVGLKVLDRRCGRGRRGRRAVVLGVRVEDLRDQQADPAGRRQTPAVEVVAPRLQASRHLNRLREVSLVRDLDDVPPRALVVFREHWRRVFHLGRTRSGWPFVAGDVSGLLAALGHMHWPVVALDRPVEGAEHASAVAELSRLSQLFVRFVGSASDLAS